MPLAKPGLIAGSIFTFSLTLGDFILPTMFGSSEFYLGQQVFTRSASWGTRRSRPRSRSSRWRSWSCTSWIAKRGGRSSRYERAVSGPAPASA